MGHAATATARGTGNFLLSSIPSGDLARMDPHLEWVNLRPTDVLYDTDSRPSHVYFLESGMASLLACYSGKDVEMASIGREGMVGMPLFFGAGHLPEKCVIQIAGRGARMPADRFVACLEESDALRDALRRYAACLYTFAAFNAACGKKHRVTSRLARWLLHAADQSGTTKLRLTHHHAALMLGVRRSSVTVAAGTLRSKGYIAYTRSTIDVVDRVGLEGAACECYGRITGTYSRLLLQSAR
jgi:CRP-like cAMP-binding protein